jgi:hypothetical protein
MDRYGRVMSSVRAISCCLVAALAVVGCAHGWGDKREDHPVEQGGWLVATSPHFRLYSDQPRAMTTETLDELERATLVLGALAFPGVELDHERIDVVLLDEHAQLERLFPKLKKAGGFFVGSIDTTAEPHLLVLTVPIGGVLAALGELREKVMHEITHLFVRRSIPRAPLWLHEGLAGYWQTIDIGDDGIVVGRPPLLEPVGEWPMLTDVVQSSRRIYKDDMLGFYAASWGAVHELYERHRDELTRFIGALAPGKSQKEAWSAVGLTPAALDVEMRRRYVTDVPLARKLPLPELPPIAPDRVEPLPAIDAELLFARLATRGGARDEATRHLDAAARVAPDLPSLAMWRAELAADGARPEDAPRIWSEALRAHPDDAALQLRAAVALFESEEHKPAGARDLGVVDAIVAKLAAHGSSATALALAAAVALEQRGAATALPLAQQSVARNPLCVKCLTVLSEARASAGDQAGAVDAVKLAIAAWPNESPPHALLDALAKLEATSGGAAARH